MQVVGKAMWGKGEALVAGCWPNRRQAAEEAHDGALGQCVRVLSG